MILLDYRQCGPDGEPSVAYVDMEKRQVITLAPDFATFLQGLVEETELTTPEADRAYEIAMVEEGTFFTAANQNLPQLRRTAGRAVDSLGSPAGGGRKNLFALHEDALSWLMYDLQYMLYSFAFPKASVKQYLHDYPLILAEDGQFTTNGYAPAFVADWMESRLKEGKLKQAGKMIGQKNCLVFTTEAMEQIVLQCKEIAQRYDL